ncbi:MAG: hypothetical protein GX032_01155 [Tenericutes bacterium]|nr:hypothetical protein [Mycoplasmatota bacterium]
MIKEIEIMDYNNIRKIAKVEDFDNVVRLEIKVLSGDEILKILYKDYSVKAFDSATNRFEDHLDAYYCIYDITKNINHLDKWNKRTSSYDIKLEEK